jgi:hypothetical protein
MKISVNDVELYTINETQLNVLKDYVPASVLEEDMKRRLVWVYSEFYKGAFRQLKDKWDPILAERVQSIPTDKDAFAQLVFQQPDYLDRAGRDALSQPVAPKGE